MNGLNGAGVYNPYAELMKGTERLVQNTEHNGL